MFGRVPFVKVCAVAAALICAGGGAIVDLGAASSADAPPASFASPDHYLCVGDLGALCVPAKVTLPDGTSFEASSPTDRLVCAWHHDFSHGRAATPTTVALGNEFSPTPVPLVTGRQQWACSVVPTHHDSPFSRTRAASAAVPVATFSCTSVQYPSDSSTRFTPPPSVTIGDRLLVKVLDPSQLCVPNGSPAGGAATQDLLCFRARVGFEPHHFFAPLLSLCVPSSTDADPADSTTTTSSTTTSSTTTSSTTTTTMHIQPCAGGIVVDGKCILPV